MRCDPDFCCGKEWNAPDIMPCPKCGKDDDVCVWEAWGHPSGELYCMACLGWFSDKPTSEYWTWHLDEQDEPVISVWEKATDDAVVRPINPLYEFESVQRSR